MSQSVMKMPAVTSQSGPAPKGKAGDGSTAGNDLCVREIIKNVGNPDGVVYFQGCELDELTGRKKEVVDDYLATDADLKVYLERYAGTPWHRQAVTSILTRRAMDELLAGRAPDFDSELGAATAARIAEDICAKGTDAIWEYLGEVNMKTGKLGITGPPRGGGW